MNEQNHPELHINEEPRNDFQDTFNGFAVFFAVLLVIAIIATIASMYK
ncbi:YqzM family protein [Paenibacillus hamazuiensis]|nr:YqzM family protein [Paenibacillus hamazuiensis]